MQMTKEAYSKLIQQDLEWLNQQYLCKESLEYRHIIEILKDSIKQYYPENLPVVKGEYVYSNESSINRPYKKEERKPCALCHVVHPFGEHTEEGINEIDERQKKWLASFPGLNFENE
jgi:hypothetical protein